MGMAASQARYLGLVARKTNLEYEGQQINQSRTALGNQSATLWNQMLTLSIPTAPNTTDFTTLQYAFSDGYNNYTISNVQSCKKEIGGVEYNTHITYFYNQEVFKAVEGKNTNPQVQVVNMTATLDPGTRLKYDTANKKYITDGGTDTWVQREVLKGSLEYQAYIASGCTVPDGKKLYAFTCGDMVSYADETQVKMNGSNFTPTEITYDVSKFMLGNTEAVKYDPADKEQAEALEQIKHDFPQLKDTTADKFYVYEKGGKICFSTFDDLKTSLDSGVRAEKDPDFQISSGIDYQSKLNYYYTGWIQEQVVEKQYALMDDASGSGRFSTIKLENMSEVFNLKSEEVTDEKSYNDAMNQYNYNLTQYEKAMADINAKTKLIQEQDRTLELRLKQLETEQKAVSTEIDAVKGIVKSNIDSSFKTFS